MKKALSKSTLLEIQKVLDKGDIVEVVLNAEAELAGTQVLGIEPDDDFGRQSVFKYVREVLLPRSLGGKVVPEKIWRAKHPKEFARVLEIAGAAPQRQEAAA